MTRTPPPEPPRPGARTPSRPAPPPSCVALPLPHDRLRCVRDAETSEAQRGPRGGNVVQVTSAEPWVAASGSGGRVETGTVTDQHDAPPRRPVDALGLEPNVGTPDAPATAATATNPATTAATTVDEPMPHGILARHGAAMARHAKAVALISVLLAVGAYLVAALGVGGQSLFDRLELGEPTVAGEALEGRDLLAENDPTGSSIQALWEDVDPASEEFLAAAAAGQRRPHGDPGRGAGARPHDGRPGRGVHGRRLRPGHGGPRPRPGRRRAGAGPAGGRGPPRASSRRTSPAPPSRSPASSSWSRPSPARWRPTSRRARASPCP